MITLSSFWKTQFVVADQRLSFTVQLKIIRQRARLGQDLSDLLPAPLDHTLTTADHDEIHPEGILSCAFALVCVLTMFWIWKRCLSRVCCQIVAFLDASHENGWVFAGECEREVKASNCGCEKQGGGKLMSVFPSPQHFRS